MSLNNGSHCGRPRKLFTHPHDPIYLKFLSIFGLTSWDDTHTWTQRDLLDNDAIASYFALRPKLLMLSYPRTMVRKISLNQSATFSVKDLITVLSQLARVYGYTVASYTREIKATKINGLDKKICFQVYELRPRKSLTKI